MSLDLTNAIYNDPDAARQHLEALHWPDGPFCPKCGSYEAAKVQGKSHRPGLYYCNGCGTTYTVTVGTVFERSKIPLHKWLLATHLMCSSKKGVSSKQLERNLGVTYKTAWFMAHRIREAMHDDDPGPMGGDGEHVQADETYFGKKADQTMPAYRQGKPYKSAKPATRKRAVFSLISGGQARTFHLKRATADNVREHLVRNVSRDTELWTDESRLYDQVGTEYAAHRAVYHAAGEYVGKGGVTTNKVENYFSIFKRGMKGVYQHCSDKHLHRYLIEFDFRYNQRSGLGVSDFERSDKALSGARGKRLTYRRTNLGAHLAA